MLDESCDDVRDGEDSGEELLELLEVVVEHKSCETASEAYACWSIANSASSATSWKFMPHLSKSRDDDPGDVDLLNGSGLLPPVREVDRPGDTDPDEAEHDDRAS